jgi:hypothetical protein
MFWMKIKFICVLFTQNLLKHFKNSNSSHHIIPGSLVSPTRMHSYVNSLKDNICNKGKDILCLRSLPRPISSPSCRSSQWISQSTMQFESRSLLLDVLPRLPTLFSWLGKLPSGCLFASSSTPLDSKFDASSSNSFLSCWQTNFCSWSPGLSNPWRPLHSVDEATGKFSSESLGLLIGYAFEYSLRNSEEEFIFCEISLSASLLQW